ITVPDEVSAADGPAGSATLESAGGTAGTTPADGGSANSAADARLTVPTALGDSVATVTDDGAILVSGAPHDDTAVVIDVYEDPLCPFCAAFESDFGAEIAAAIDDGALAVRYRMVDFLNGMSASGDYSTRALAAMLSLTEQAGSEPGLVAAFHASLF